MAGLSERSGGMMNTSWFHWSIRGVLAIACSACLAMATVRAQSDDEELAKFQFYNGYPYPLDIYLLDENQDPPEEQYQVTVPNVVIQPGRPGQVGRILRGQEALAVDFYPGTRFRLKLHRQKNSGWETKGTALPERPAPDALTLYDIPTAPGGTYTHSASPGNYLQSRLVPGTEVVLLSKNGCLLIDDNINEHGTNSRNGYHVRRDAGLFDSVSEEKHYRWTVRPAQNGRPDMFSLELVTTENRSESPIFLMYYPTGDGAPQSGFVFALVTDDWSQYFSKDTLSFSTLPSNTPGFFHLASAQTGQAAAQDERTLLQIVPWGQSAVSLELLKLIGLPGATDEWRKLEPSGFAKVTKGARLSGSEAKLGQLQVDSCTAACRAGYHLRKLNPLDLQDNGLNPQTGNPIFAPPMDPTSGDETFYALSGTRIPLDFYVQRIVRLESSGKETTFNSEQEWSDVSASTLGVDASGDISATLGTGGLNPVQVSTTVSTKYSFGKENSTTNEITSGATNGQTAVVKSKWKTQLWMVLNRDYAVLAEPFKDELLGLATNPSQESFDAFFEKYGTHYTIGSLMGGRAGVYSHARRSGNSLYTRGDTSYSWSAGVGAIVNSSGSNSGSSKKSYDDTNLEWRDYSVGGGGGNFDAWSADDLQSLIPIKVYLRPIWQLASVDLLFPSDATEANRVFCSELRTAMARAWSKHLNPPVDAANASTNPENLFMIALDNFKVTCDQRQKLPNTVSFDLGPGYFRFASLETVKGTLLGDFDNFRLFDFSETKPHILDSHAPAWQTFQFNVFDPGQNNLPQHLSHVFTLPGDLKPHWNESFGLRLLCRGKRLVSSTDAGLQSRRYDADPAQTELLDRFGQGLIHQSGNWGDSKRRLFQMFMPAYKAAEEFHLAYISSPVRVLRRSWSNRSFWPGMDEIEMECLLDVLNDQNESVRVKMSYTLRVGLIEQVRGSGKPFDEGMPVFEAFEPGSRKAKGGPSLESLPGIYQSDTRRVQVNRRTPPYAFAVVDVNTKQMIGGIGNRKVTDEILFTDTTATGTLGDVDFVRNGPGSLVNRVEGFSIGAEYFRRVGDLP